MSRSVDGWPPFLASTKSTEKIRYVRPDEGVVVVVGLVEVVLVVGVVDAPLDDVLAAVVLVVLEVVVVLGSFGCVKGSRAGPLRLETVGVLWMLTAGTAESCVTGTASGVTCATAG